MKILRAIGKIYDDFVKRAVSKDKAVRVAFAPWLKWVMPAAVCLVIAVTVALPQLLKTPAVNPDNLQNEESSQPNGLVPARLDTIRGLPARDYTWDEGDDGVEAKRLATNKLRLLMRQFDSYDPTVRAAFAIVRVESVEKFTEDIGDIVEEGQIAACGVLYNVLGDGLDVPFKIRQYLYGGCTSGEETNLIREGGVYVLPLVTIEGQETWEIYGDLDVLFEVDDKGLIHSHSSCYELNKYDNKPLSELWNDIEYLKERPLLISRLAEYIGDDYDVEFAGGDGKFNWDTVRLYLPQTGWNQADKESFSAKLENGKITVPEDAPNYNIFLPFAGMTIDEFDIALGEIRQFLGLESVGQLPPMSAPDPYAEAHITTIFDKEVNNFEGVTMVLVEDSVTTTNVYVTMLNETDRDVQYGSSYDLQKSEDGKWYSLSYIIENWAFTDEAYTLVKGEPAKIAINWKTFHGVLPEGSYRVVKSVMDFRGTGDYDTYYLAAEFNIN